MKTDYRTTWQETVWRATTTSWRWKCYCLMRHVWRSQFSNKIGSQLQFAVTCLLKRFLYSDDLLLFGAQSTLWHTWRGNWVVCRCIVWLAVEQCWTHHVSVFRLVNDCVLLHRTVMDTSLESMETAVVGHHDIWPCDQTSLAWYD